ncbi:MAG: hypothetical protein BRD39_04480 [Bacteroidetes bacterium QH_9_64_21]|nr:MAG: hypothetical protein BRD39_04480 [Bacteroidetes bacterium QH_9_64_21]
MTRLFRVLRSRFRPDDEAFSTDEKDRVQLYRLISLLGAVLIPSLSVLYRGELNPAVPAWTYLGLSGLFAGLFAVSYMSRTVRRTYVPLMWGLMYVQMVWITAAAVANDFANERVLAVLLTYASIGVVIELGARSFRPILWFLAFGFLSVAGGLVIAPAPQTAPSILLSIMAVVGLTIGFSLQGRLTIREQRNLLDRLVETSPNAIVRLARDGTVLQASGRVEAVLGLSAKALRGRTYDDLEWEPGTFGEDSTEEAVPFAQVLQAGVPIRGIECSIRCPDGTRRFLSVSGAPLRGKDGEAVFHVQDITEQKDRERVLERQNDLFERAQEIAGVGVWEYDVETDTSRWTTEVYRIHGRSPENAPVFDDIIDYYHPDDQPRLEDAFAKAIEHGEPYNLELRLRTEAGDERWVRTRGEPQQEDGEVVRVRGTIQDITERKRRERSLQNRQEKLEGLYEATNHLLEAEDEEDLSIRLTSLVHQTLDYSATTIRLARDGELVPAHVPDAVQDHMPERPSYDIDGEAPAAEAYRSGETCAFDDLSAKVDTVDRGDIRATVYVPMGDYGLISVGSLKEGGIGTFDQRLLEVLGSYAALVLERLEREQELLAAKEEAEAASRMKSSFLANMSHEIRTPLTSIIGFAEAVGTTASELELPEGSPLPKYANLIEQGGKRLLDTLEGVLNLSKLEAGQMELGVERVDLADQVHRTAEELRPKANEKHISVHVEAGDPPTQAEADEGGVQIVLRNLMSNAIKYTEEGGHVWVRAYRDDGQAVLEVRDTGIGMKPETAEDLFEPFRQASQGLSREYEGTGVGLAVTKEATEQMDGHLEVDTEKGEGSRFVVRLPRAEAVDHETEGNERSVDETKE